MPEMRCSLGLFKTPNEVGRRFICEVYILCVLDLLRASLLKEISRKNIKERRALILERSNLREIGTQIANPEKSAPMISLRNALLSRGGVEKGW